MVFEYMGASVSLNGDVLLSLRTRPEHRRNGYARRVMNMAIQHARDLEHPAIWLFVAPFDGCPCSKEILHKFYSSLGFVDDIVRTTSYTHWMRLDLKE